MSDSWVAIDFETANSHRGSPCGVGMVGVEAGRITEPFSSSDGLSDTVALKDGDGLAQVAGLGRAAA